jgi:hypothetical protein
MGANNQFRWGAPIWVRSGEGAGLGLQLSPG